MEKKEEIIEHHYCNTCNRWTKHSLLYTYNFSDQIGDISFNRDINIWYCRGCEDVLFQIVFSNSKEIDQDGNLIIHKSVFPDRSFSKIIPKRFLTLPQNLNLLYFEIVTTINHNSLILSSIGLRTLLEGICKDKGITGNTLEQLIDNINFVNDNIKKNLHGIRFMGNDAAHELDCPSREEILIALDIMEDLMNYTYDLDYKSSRILDIMNQKHLNKVSPILSSEEIKALPKKSV